MKHRNDVLSLYVILVSNAIFICPLQILNCVQSEPSQKVRLIFISFLSFRFVSQEDVVDDEAEAKNTVVVKSSSAAQEEENYDDVS